MFPPRCPGCSREGTWFCDACLGKLQAVRPPLCQHCGLPLPGGGLCLACQGQPSSLEGIRYPFFLEGPLKEAVHELKYHNIKALAQPLGELLWRGWPSLPAGVVIPVPLHPRRLRHRGYNQAALLAREVGRRAGWPVVEDVLVRLRDTHPQARTLGATERRKNVHGAFGCCKADLAGQTVVLVDDVCTTGSTLEACALALKQGGAGPIWGLTLAMER